MANRKIKINRAPVWAAVVAERLGHDWEHEKFRPRIPEAAKGWGAAGEMDLDYIRSLAD